MQKSSNIFFTGLLCFCLFIVLIISCTPGKKDSDSVQNGEQGTDTDTEISGKNETGEDVPAEDPGRVDLRQRTEWPPLDSKDNYIEWMKNNRPCSEEFLEKRWDRAMRIRNFHKETPDNVLQAFLLTPREIFARDYNRDVAYDMNWHMIEDGQTISGPHLVCRMTENLDIKPEHKVLEIGTGSGYHSALMTQMANNVYSIEIKTNLYHVTDSIYTSILDKYPEYRNVQRKNADGYYGWEEYAPFDRIVVTCGIDHIPPSLLKQLTVGGIMVIPVGPMAGQQVILKVTKTQDEEGKIHLTREDIYGGKITEHFVPFTKEDGSWHSQENQ
ncbi:MAG: protein-L-isoaspartate O-methyltransferase [Spirochaetales bacterium]|nr:protein-L-isoaspartate O-methyltransferase [Spirochaetales bacterium]